MNQVLYICFGLAVITLIIPVGYFTSFFIEVDKFCKSGVLVEWIIIIGSDAAAIVCYLICIYFLIKISWNSEQSKGK